MSGTRIMAALDTFFNFLVLNLVLLIASLPIVTIPIAVNAATSALDRWRGEGEDRVVREFLITLRSRPPLKTTACTGVPLAALVLGVMEVRHFLGSGQAVDRVGLGLGLVALLITLTALGYVFLLAARNPSAAATELWSAGATLAVRNLVITGPLFLIEIAAATTLTLIAPALLLVGIPIAALNLMRVTAQFGLRRAVPKHQGQGS
jgi:hypothetical protein